MSRDDETDAAIEEATAIAEQDWIGLARNKVTALEGVLDSIEAHSWRAVEAHKESSARWLADEKRRERRIRLIACGSIVAAGIALYLAWPRGVSLEWASLSSLALGALAVAFYAKYAPHEHLTARWRWAGNAAAVVAGLGILGLVIVGIQRWQSAPGPYQPVQIEQTTASQGASR